MLRFHLNGDIDVSSRKLSFINDSVSWMTEQFDLCDSSRIIDFGCGPGLYTSRFAKLRAYVCGVDFSGRSIAYARQQAADSIDPITYIEANYLEYEPEGNFDLGDGTEIFPKPRKLAGRNGLIDTGIWVTAVVKLYWLALYLSNNVRFHSV